MNLPILSGGASPDAPQIRVGLLRPLPGVAVRPHPDRGQLQQFLKELRLPLVASSGMLNLLEETELPGPVVMALAALRNHNDYLKKVLTDFGSFGDLEQNNVESQPATCETLPWLHAFFTAQRQQAAEVKVDLVVSYRSFVPNWVVLDPVLVEQAFASMLHVAVQRSLPTQLRVAVHYVEGRSRDEAAHLVVELQTCGGGFAEIELGYVFAPFQVRDVASRPLLGLSLGQRQAELAGGELRVESVGRSACNYRISVRAEPAEQAVWLDPLGNGSSLGPVRPGCVLFVGRCEHTVQRCRPSLERAGYTVERAEREELVLARLQQLPKRWSAVVVDATCKGERLLGFLDATRATGYDAPLIALVEDATEAEKSVTSVDALLYAPSGAMMLRALRTTRAARSCGTQSPSHQSPVTKQPGAYSDCKNATSAD